MLYDWLNEVFDTKQAKPEIEYTDETMDSSIYKLPDGKQLQVSIGHGQATSELELYYPEIKSYVGSEVVFAIRGSSEKGWETKQGTYETKEIFQMFGTIVNHIIEYMESMNPDFIYFSADKNEETRYPLYKRMVDKLIRRVPKYVALHDDYLVDFFNKVEYIDRNKIGNLSYNLNHNANPKKNEYNDIILVIKREVVGVVTQAYKAGIKKYGEDTKSGSWEDNPNFDAI